MNNLVKNHNAKWFAKNILILALSVIMFARLYQGLPINFGWVYLNKGLLNRDEKQIVQAQSILSKQNLPEAQRKRYIVLKNSKLEQDEILVNGSFEFLSQGWVVLGTDYVLPSISSQQFYSGRHSLQIVFSGADVNFYTLFQETMVDPETCYLLQAQFKADNLTDIVALDVWDAERGYQHWYGGRTKGVEGTTDWVPVSLHFCTADDIQRVQVRIRRYGGYGQTVSGTVWIDDVSLRIDTRE